MKYQLLLAFLAPLVGCKSAVQIRVIPQPQSSTIVAKKMVAVTPSASEWTPVAKGDAYQLSLKNGQFGFCDETGSQHINLTTGKQSPGTEACDPNHEEIQSNCDDTVMLHGIPDNTYDDITINNNDYVLKGHAEACDRMGLFLVVATGGGVELIDGARNKVAILDSGMRAVIGSDWVAWQPLDRKKNELQLETVAKAMEHATTPK